MNRRQFLCSTGAAFAASMIPTLASATIADVAPDTMIVHYDPGCGCCSAWVAHMRDAGFAVETRATSQIDRIKARLGVPQALASCHTAEVAGYVVEGHVPAEAVARLLRERPAATGISVPGMPIGSPGMEVPGMEDDAYEVILFDASRSERFARYRGATRTGQ